MIPVTEFDLSLPFDWPARQAVADDEFCAMAQDSRSRGAKGQCRSGSLEIMPAQPVKPREIDANLYMFALCKHLQTICVDRHAIHCLIDADALRKLPEAVCRMLGLMVAELVTDADQCSRPEITSAPITVTLRRQGTVCLCTVSSECLADSYGCAQHGLRRLVRLATELRGGCIVRRMLEPGMIAIIFDIDLVERCFPAAIRRYRWSR
jgi:hypothetical protein